MTPFTTDFPVHQTFGIPAPAAVRVPGYERPGPLTPVGHPDYRFRPALLSDLLAWHQGLARG